MEQDVEAKSVLYTQGSIWSHLSENSFTLLQNLLFLPLKDFRKVVKRVEEFRCSLHIRKTTPFADA